MDVITENTAVPNLRFKEFNDNWQQKTLGDVGKLINGLTYSPKDITDDGVLVLRSSNVQNNQLALDDNVYVNVESFNPVKENDILICVRNGSKRLIGKNCLIDKGSEGIAFGAFMTIYRSLNNKFIFYLFSHSSYYRNIHQNLGATINSINNNDLKKFKFFFPSLVEQEKITSFLNAADNKLQQLTKKKGLLIKYKKGIMQKVFSKEIRFKDENGNKYPNWEEKKFEKIFKSNSSKQISNNKILNEGKYVVIEQGKKEKIGYSNDEKKVIKNNGIIAYGDHTTIIKYVDIDFISGPGIKLLKPLFHDNLKYLYYNLKHNNIKPQGYKRHFSIVRKIKLQIPILDEQKKIANFLSSIDKKIDLVNIQIDNTKAFKKGLLQQMFV